MNRLTFTIRTNDELTLKYNLQNYVRRIQGSKRHAKERLCPGCCTDPQYIAYWFDLMLFRGKTVSVIYTNIKYRLDNDERIIGLWHYITVRDRLDNIVEFPIEFIDKSHCLKRDHHCISLHNKTLIVGE